MLKKWIAKLFLVSVVALLLCCAGRIAEAAETEYTWLIEPKYEIGRTFSEGLWPVRKDGKFGYVDSTDAIVIDFQFADAGLFREGKASVLSTSGKWGLINLQGKYLWQPTNKSPLVFTEGMAPVQSGDLWGFINASGDLLIPPHYEVVQRFSEGLAAVKIDGVWQSIDTTGKVRAKLSDYRRCGYYSEGMAAVLSGDRMGYIDISGDLRIPLRYLRAMEFLSERAIVNDKSGWGVINASGEWILSPQYNAIEGFNDNKYFFVQSGDLWGVTDNGGKLIMEYQFQGVKIFEQEDNFYKNSPKMFV